MSGSPWRQTELLCSTERFLFGSGALVLAYIRETNTQRFIVVLSHTVLLLDARRSVMGGIDQAHDWVSGKLPGTVLSFRSKDFQRFLPQALMLTGDKTAHTLLQAVTIAVRWSCPL